MTFIFIKKEHFDLLKVFEFYILSNKQKTNFMKYI